MPLVGFETTIPVSERAKTVHALDRWATVTGGENLTPALFGPPRSPQELTLD
jgi:hypothetical protein